MKTATVRVRVANTYHFAYDDGRNTTRAVRPAMCGTAAEISETQEKTYENLAASSFNKIRRFPKHYVYNLKSRHSIRLKFAENSPWSPSDFETEAGKAPRNMFGGIDAAIENPDEVDYTRPNPSYFEHGENTIARLGTMESKRSDCLISVPSV